MIYVVKRAKMYRYDPNRRTLNVRLEDTGKVKGIYFSINTKAINGGILYFKDKAIAQKYVDELKATLDYLGIYPLKIEIASHMKEETLYEVAPGLFISKNTDFYKNVILKS